MPSKLGGSVFHPVRVDLLFHQGFAQGTEFAEVAAIECELHLLLEPGHIISWVSAGKTLHRSGIVLDKGDSVAQHCLKWGQGAFLPPLVQNSLGLVKAS